MKERYAQLTLIVLMPLLLAFDSKTQIQHLPNAITQHFNAYRNGRHIGWLRITQSQQQDKKVLSTESQLNLDMVLQFEARAMAFNQYAGSYLQSATVHRTLNNKVKLDNAIAWQQTGYKVLRGETKEQVGLPIANTVTSLYFGEPVGVKQVFSEVYLTYLTVKPLGASVYETPLPKGGRMTYSYQQGRLVQVEAATNYGTISFKSK
jgi:hypothetical protein